MPVVTSCVLTTELVKHKVAYEINMNKIQYDKVYVHILWKLLHSDNRGIWEDRRKRHF